MTISAVPLPATPNSDAQIEMAITAAFLIDAVEAELAQLHDVRAEAQVRALLVLPAPVDRGWDYGADDESHPCWSVLEHPASNTGIAYCGQGFGPRTPWGLVFLAGTEHMSMGMDANWFPGFLDAYFDSPVAAELPLWRVFRRGDGQSPDQPLSAEGSWESTWAEVERLRALHPGHRYDCDQGIYRRRA